MNKPGIKVNQQMEQGQETVTGIDHAGVYLRKLRTEKGLSLKEVCEATRISEVNIRAMEDQDFASLPADTFTRGLLHNYARYLGADAAHVVARFMRERDKSQTDGKRGKMIRPVTRRILSPKKLAEPAQVSSITMAGVLLLFIVILFAGFSLYTSWNPFSFLTRETESNPSAVMPDLPGKQETTPVQPEAGNDDPAPALGEGQIQPAETAAPPEAPLTGTNSVTVEFLKDTRLIFTRDKEPPVSALYKKGENLTLPTAASLQLTFDQADSALILVNNQPVAFPEGTKGLFTLRLPIDSAQPPSP